MCGLTFVLFAPTDNAETKQCLQSFDEQEGASGYTYFRPHESAGVTTSSHVLLV